MQAGRRAWAHHGGMISLACTSTLPLGPALPMTVEDALAEAVAAASCRGRVHTEGRPACSVSRRKPSLPASLH